MSALSRFVILGNAISIIEVTALLALPVASAALFATLQGSMGHDLSLALAGGFAVVGGIALVVGVKALVVLEDNLAADATRS